MKNKDYNLFLCSNNIIITLFHTYYTHHYKNINNWMFYDIHV